MKRFHVHLHVDDLTQSVGFYAQLFAAQPTRLEADYAKWMLDDPAVNFAISTRGQQPGIDHLGIQTDDAAELDALKARAEAAGMALLDEGPTSCCYARSEKHWVTDPQGIAWEHFHTLSHIPLFRDAAVPKPPPLLVPEMAPAMASKMVLETALKTAPVMAPARTESACCVPAAKAAPSCCGGA